MNFENKVALVTRQGFVPNLDAILTILGVLLFFNNGIAYLVHITFPIKLTFNTFLKSSITKLSM